jgi:DNA (cytosine-5)-methyltransferase 1
MRYLSVCSGIEAASQAFKPLGWEPVAFSEIEPFPCAVLKHHHPDVPNWGDMSKFKEWPDATVDVLCGGTPCQSFSVAGLRQGLADPRGNLMLTFGAIAARYRPRWLVWENVPGVLSSNGGRDFGTFLGMLGQLRYGVAYRILDAQHVRTRRFPLAVPQRRRRVFVVGYLGDWRRAAAVLFDRESLSGHPAPRREAGKGFAHGVAPSLVSSGRGVDRAGDTRGQDPVVAICADTAPTLDASFHDKQGLDNQHINGGGGYLFPSVSLCLSTGVRIDAESETLLPINGGGFDVAHSLRGEGHDASEYGTGRGTPIVPVAGTLCRDTFSGGASGRPESATAGHFIPVAFDCKGTEVQTAVDGSHPTLRSMGHAGSHANAGGHAAVAYAIQERAICENPNAGPDGAGIRQDGASYTLEARGTTQAVAFDLRGRNGGSMPEGPHHTANIRASSGGSSRSYVAQPWAVRRLTPTECERLQAFPDDFTRIPGASKGGWRDVDESEDIEELRALGMELRQKGNQWRVRDPDGPRYKALGNSWAVNCAEWIAERMAEVDGWARADLDTIDKGGRDD